jgi:hypothetical protein
MGTHCSSGGSFCIQSNNCEFALVMAPFSGIDPGDRTFLWIFSRNFMVHAHVRVRWYCVFPVHWRWHASQSLFCMCTDAHACVCVWSMCRLCASKLYHHPWLSMFATCKYQTACMQLATSKLYPSSLTKHRCVQVVLPWSSSMATCICMYATCKYQRLVQLALCGP